MLKGVSVLQHKMNAGAMTGIAMTVAVGAAAAYMLSGHSAKNQRRVIKKNTARAAKAVGDVVSDVVGNVYGMIK